MTCGHVDLNVVRLRWIVMPEREVCSPVSRKGSKVGSGPPMMPGARSNPSARRDNAPEPPRQAEPDARRSSKKPAPGLATIVGPEG